jgi:hypothetical protein
MDPQWTRLHAERKEAMGERGAKTSAGFLLISSTVHWSIELMIFWGKLFDGFCCYDI